MAEAEMAPESAAPPVPSPDWTGTVTFVSGDGDSFDVDSRAAEAALAVKRFLVDKDEEDEPACQFPVEKVSPAAAWTHISGRIVRRRRAAV